MTMTIDHPRQPLKRLTTTLLVAVLLAAFVSGTARAETEQPPPYSPQVHLTAGDAQIRVSWSVEPSVVPMTGVTIEMDGNAELRSVGPGVTKTTFTDLVNGKTYAFRARAFNDAGPGPWSLWVEATPSNVPSRPGNITFPWSPITAPWSPDGGSIRLAWNAPLFDGGSAITGYRITQSSVSGTVTINVGDVQAHTATGLAYGETYTFTVAAINANGVGDASHPSAAVTVRAAPAVPPDVRVEVVGPTSVAVTWGTPPDGGSPITRYVIWVSGPTGRYVEVDAPATSTTITGLLTGMDYAFSVQARNAYGSSPWSAPRWANPSEPRGLPGTPTGVTAAAGEESATVKWTAPADSGGEPITAYRVTSSTGLAMTVAATARSATFAQLEAGVPTTLQVAAVNEIGEGPASTSSNAVTPSPRAVMGLTRTVRFDTPTASAPRPRVELRWINQGQPEAIEVTWSEDTNQRSVTLRPAPTTYTVTGLEPGKAYRFEVRAVAGQTRSIPSTVTASGSAVSAAANPTLVTFGSSTTLSGRLTRAGTTTGLANQLVHLQIRTQNASGTWTDWSSTGEATFTGATGAFSITHRTPRNAKYRIAFTGAGDHLGSVSASPTVKVAPKATATLSSTSVRRGSSVHLSGTVSPNLSGRVVYLQQHTGTGWVDMRGGTLDTTSSYRFTIKPPSKGTYTYRVRIPAAAPYAEGFSPSRSVWVS